MKIETNIEMLNRLYESGDLDKLVKAGLMSPSVLMHRNLYNSYISRVQALALTAKPCANARNETAKNFGVSVSTVERVVRTLRS